MPDGNHITELDRQSSLGTKRSQKYIAISYGKRAFDKAGIEFQIGRELGMADG